MILLSLAMVVTIPCAIWFIVILWRTPNVSASSAAKRVDVYEQGVVMVEQQGPSATFRFDSMALSQQIVTTRYNGIDTSTRYTYTLTDAQGGERVLTQFYERIAQLGQVLQEGVTLAQCNGVVAGVRAGQEVPFGPVSLREDGIVTRKGVLAWDTVDRVTTGHGAVAFHARGKRLPFATVQVHKVVNVGCLLRAIGRLRPPKG